MFKSNLSTRHTCFCCNFTFNSSYTGQGDKFCAQCRKELTTYNNKFWVETEDKSFQQKGQFKHKIFYWKQNKKVYIIIGPQKIKSPNKDYIFYHFVRPVLKYHCENNDGSGCGKYFFSLIQNSQCPCCGNIIYKMPISRFMICHNASGEIKSDKIPEINALPCIDLIEKWAWKEDYSETCFLSEIVMIYLFIKNKNLNFLYMNSYLKNDLLPKTTSYSDIKSEELYNFFKEDNSSVMNDITNSNLQKICNDNNQDSNIKRSMSIDLMDNGDPLFIKRKITVKSEYKDGPIFV